MTEMTDSNRVYTGKPFAEVRNEKGNHGRRRSDGAHPSRSACSIGTGRCGNDANRNVEFRYVTGYHQCYAHQRYDERHPIDQRFNAEQFVQRFLVWLFHEERLDVERFDEERFDEKIHYEEKHDEEANG